MKCAPSAGYELHNLARPCHISKGGTAPHLWRSGGRQPPTPASYATAIKIFYKNSKEVGWHKNDRND